jgi:hypothetical protein
MSYRITKQTQITDEKLAAEALRLAGMSFTKQGNSLRITSGRLSGAHIDLKTGMVTGDSDFGGHSEQAFGLLRQYYGEAMCRDVALKQGVTVGERQIERIDGEECVVLYCRQA